MELDEETLALLGWPDGSEMEEAHAKLVVIRLESRQKIIKQLAPVQKMGRLASLKKWRKNNAVAYKATNDRYVKSEKGKAARKKMNRKQYLRRKALKESQR